MDILFYIVLIVGAVIGYKQGAFKQVAHFLGVAVGLLIAATLYHQFGDFRLVGHQQDVRDDNLRGMLHLIVEFRTHPQLLWLKTCIAANEIEDVECYA